MELVWCIVKFEGLQWGIGGCFLCKEKLDLKRQKHRLRKKLEKTCRINGFWRKKFKFSVEEIKFSKEIGYEPFLCEFLKTFKRYFICKSTIVNSFCFIKIGTQKITENSNSTF